MIFSFLSSLVLLSFMKVTPLRLFLLKIDGIHETLFLKDFLVSLYAPQDQTRNGAHYKCCNSLIKWYYW